MRKNRVIGSSGHRANEEDKIPHIPIETSFDLHSFHPRDVASAVEEYLREARARGFSQVRLVHGKGIGVRRAEVRRLLAARNDLVDFFDASPELGGFGATMVVLRRADSAPGRSPDDPIAR